MHTPCRPSPRIVVTGIGCVSAAGLSARDYWNAICAGEPRTRLLRGHDDPSGDPRIGAPVVGCEPEHVTDSRLRKFMDRTGAFALAAARQALADGGIETSPSRPQPLDVCLGTCGGAIAWCEAQFRRVAAASIRLLHPYTSIIGYPGNLVGLLTIELGLQGRGIVMSSLDSSGVDALAYAVQRIRGGEVDRVLVGAADAPLTSFVFRLLARARLLSRRFHDPAGACRPFDVEREGIVLGEGAAMLLVERLEAARARGARPYAEIASLVAATRPRGQAARADGTGPLPLNGHNPVTQALRDAGVAPAQVAYVSADGTGSPEGDREEACLLADAFRTTAAAPPVSSVKGIVGHALSAAPLLQSITCLLALAGQIAPPTANCREVDVECRSLRYVRNRPRVLSGPVAVQHSASLLQERRTAAVFRSLEGGEAA